MMTRVGPARSDETVIPARCLMGDVPRSSLQSEPMASRQGPAGMSILTHYHVS
jgi:hypothetical protein